jgi:competence ComEA-like helix-hairpin-helix protein
VLFRSEPPPQPATVWPTQQVVVTPAETTAATVETTPASAECEAPLTPLEQNQFLININQCTAEDLTRVSGIGASLAQRIIEFRNLHGRVTDINQLRQIPGLGNKTYRRIIGAGPSPRGKITRLVNYLVGAPQDRDLNIQEIVRHASQLPGVVGCIMAMEDGLFVTGQLPPSMDTQTVSAFAPQLFRRVSRYVKEMNVGRVRRFSLFTEEHPVSIFHTGKIFLIVLHAPNRFSKSILIRFERITKEINRMCTERVAL